MSTRVRLTIDVDVEDEAALRKYAADRALASFGVTDLADIAPTIDAVVLEALVISNENPAPDEYGIDLVDVRSEVLS